MTDNERGYGQSGTSNPAEQLTQSLKTVSEALKSAGERVASSSQEVGLCALRQAEQNSQALFDTLRAMASAKTQAEQLREMSELLARTSREAWAPVTDALAKQMPK
jgi:hypothetical protein